MLKRLRFLLMLTLAAISVQGQVTTSSMSGKVTDTTKETIIGATIQAIHEPSGTRYGAITNVDGRYTIQGMRVGGPYKVEVSYVGYQSAVYTGISLGLGDQFVLDVTLKEASELLDEVVVIGTAGNSNMRSDRAGAITNLNVAAINNTPTVSRSVNDLIRMTPQATINSNGANIGGGNYRQSFVTIDGAAFNNAFGIGQSMPSSGSPISLDALEQISISLTPYDVRQSGFTGASVNAVTRSGDNEFRASVYTYLNNEKFRGNNVDGIKFEKSKSQYNMYGARIGGPIIKDKLFFFANFEIEKSEEPGPARVAATADKPYTDGSDNVARPTADKMNEISNYLITKYGYNPGAYQGYSSESPGYKILARLDWNISRDHKLNIRYSDTKIKNPTNCSTSTSGLADNKFSETTRTSMNAMFFQNSRYYQESNFSSVAGELTSRFKDGEMNNMLRASFSHQNEPRSYEGGDFPFVDIVEGGNTYTSFGTELFSYGNLRDVKTFNITDEFTFNYKNHAFLAGLQFENNVTKNGFQRFGTGYYQYNSWQDFLEDNPAQFAITHSMNSDFSQAYPTFKYQQFSIYLQDEISLSDNLKIQAGLRFELPMYPSLTTYNEQVAKTWLSAGDYDYPTLMKQYNTTDLPSTKVMVSPRIGFNWDVLGNRAVVVRGGTGLFTGRIPFVWIVAQAGDSGVLQTTYTAKAGDGKVIPSFTSNRLEMLKQIYPNGLNASTAQISSVSLMDNELKLPQTWKTSLAVDVRLPWGIKGSIEGIYNKDLNPVLVSNVGLKPGVYTNIPDYADNRPVYGPTYDRELQKAYLLTNASKAGYYYSITARLEKNFDFGLNAMVAYTHSGAKNVTDGIGDQIASGWYVPPTVKGANCQELGYASYVMPHRLIASVSYRKEYIKHLATGISLFYEGGPSGRLSYTYTSAVVGDKGANNLIYVPNSKDELTFVDMKDKDGNVIYTKENQATDFWNFVNNDNYLKTRKGKYAERNGKVYPWSHRFDLKITQDIFQNICGKRNTIQLGLDILNVGNLLNKKWGASWSYTQNAILKQTNKLTQGGTEVPTYNFVKNGNEILNKDFTKSIGYSSTYSMQLSIRYIFN